MRGFVWIAGLTLPLCLAACVGGSGNAADSAPDDGANAMAAADNGSAAADEGNVLATMPPPLPFPGQTSAADETGPCPFELRNLRATSGGPNNEEGHVGVEAERRSADNREASIEARRGSSPPVLALDLRSVPPVGNVGWTVTAFGLGPLPPSFTTVVLYCHGEEIARAPIRRGG